MSQPAQDSPDPGLGRAATHDVLHALRESGALSVQAHREAAWWIARPPPPATWRRILDPLALVLGITLIVAGVLYVVAFNWAELGRFSKVAVGMAPLAVAGLTTMALGTRGLAGKVLATSGIPLTLGALLAIGLAFPTNGDSWALFALWAALCIPWAIAARLGAAWLGVALAVDIAFSLFFSTVRLPEHPIMLDAILGTYVVVHALGWAGFSVAHALGVRGADTWVRQTLLAPVIGLLAFWPLEAVTINLWGTSDGWGWTLADPVGMLLFVVIGVVVHVGFVLKKWGPFPVAIQLLTLMAVVTTLSVRMLVEVLDDLEVAALLLTLPLGAFVLLQLAGSGVWLLWGWRRQLDPTPAAPTEAP